MILSFSQKNAYSFVTDDTATTVVLDRFICSSSVAKFKSILMGGELGTQIRDLTLPNLRINDYQNRDQYDITFFGAAVYLLRVHIDCPRKPGTDLFETDCTPAHQADVFIDFNDDGNFDESENRIYRRAYIDEKPLEHTYDLQILIPRIDAITTIVGIHRMRVKLARSGSYQKQCGKNELTEVREYMVNIIPRKICPGTATISLTIQLCFFRTSIFVSTRTTASTRTRTRTRIRVRARTRLYCSIDGRFVLSRGEPLFLI